ncbi:nucleotide exchange factor GrpE [Bowdeniella nasicola]|uniref:nucleotide exchange factor GrpE n=1 Tax=Bowdeniella nasicola TaxID=208480 RepID=UPI000A6CEA92|nr:nucleotide exchange factor GrpE [Bowdeniella nasicola]
MSEFENNDEKPIVRDRRRIDPETGKVRRDPAAAGPGPGQGSEPAPEGVDETHAAEATEFGTEDAGAEQGEAAEGDFGPAFTDENPQAAEADANLADLKAENAKLSDDLARARAAHYNTEQEYANFVRRSREAASLAKEDGVARVVESLFGVLDDIALARQHDDLTGTFASVATKLENVLEQHFSVARFGEAGEEFDPEIHEALMATPSSDVTVATISQVMQPGYRIGDRILRAARVAVANPE